VLRPMVRRNAVLAAVVALSGALSGCVYATAGVKTFTIEPLAPVGAAGPIEDLRPSATEVAYARTTARVVFKRRDGERTTRFVSADAREGYALCLRAGGQFALLVFQRRVFDTAISQAADDTAILRSAADTAVCRSAGDWTRV
jgi:hypothetical protein